MKLINIHRSDTPNSGDLMCAPYHYFDFLRENSCVVDIKNIKSNIENFHFKNEKSSIQGSALIIGGGGLLDCDYFGSEIDYISSINVSPLKVLWGVGSNKYEVSSISKIFDQHSSNYSNFDLIGIRDYQSGFEWVPCASCMHEVFLAPKKDPIKDVVTILHSAFLSKSDFKDLPNIIDNNENFENIIAHIESGDTILTNSYHGAYWAQLLGKKVIGFPTTTKMFNMKYPFPICTPASWSRYLKMAYVADEALFDSIDANKKFSIKVKDRLYDCKSKKTLISISNNNVNVKKKNDSLISDKLTIAEKVQNKLIAILACPETKGPIDIIKMEVANNAIKSGFLVSRFLGKVVGLIKNFQLDFVRYENEILTDGIIQGVRDGVLPYRSDFTEEWNLIDYNAESIVYSGFRGDLVDEDMCYISGPGASISFEATGLIELMLFSHPWSGIIEVKFKNQKFTFDLYAPHTTIPTSKFIDLENDKVEVTITISSLKNDLSSDRQCLFAGYKFKSSKVIPLIHTRKPRIRGADFNANFYELLSSVPNSGILLDLGGGNRQLADERYVNLDYAAYTDPDIIADGMCLPFRNKSIDAVYSSGVFEHIPNPLMAAKEITRVLKPGGKALICWSFMQPIHSEGQHFFNATPWGVTYAFNDLRPLNIYYDTSLCFLLDWAVSVLSIKNTIKKEDLNYVLENLREWDKIIPNDKKSYMANGVWVEFIKE